MVNDGPVTMHLDSAQPSKWGMKQLMKWFLCALVAVWMINLTFWKPTSVGLFIHKIFVTWNLERSQKGGKEQFSPPILTRRNVKLPRWNFIIRTWLCSKLFHLDLSVMDMNLQFMVVIACWNSWNPHWIIHRTKIIEEHPANCLTEHVAHLSSARDASTISSV